MSKLDMTGMYDKKEDNPTPTASNGASASASRITIKKKEFKESKTGVGWRLNSTTVDRIKQCAFDSRMPINDFVQELLDKALDEIDIA